MQGTVTRGARKDRKPFQYKVVIAVKDCPAPLPKRNLNRFMSRIISLCNIM